MSPSFVVGIAGGSCSGKSTLSHQLKAKLEPIECGVINMDTFHRHEEGPLITLSDGEIVANYNHPDSTDHLQALSKALSATKPVLIVEGLMVLHLPHIRNILNLAIFVETDATIRAVRRMIRSKERSPNHSLEWIGRYYLECAIPGHEEFVQPSKKFADLIVSGNGEPSRSVSFLAEAITRAMGFVPPESHSP